MPQEESKTTKRLSIGPDALPLKQRAYLAADTFHEAAVRERDHHGDEIVMELFGMASEIIKELAHALPGAQ